MSTIDVDIPEEYLSFDYGFSAVDDPGAREELPLAAISPEVENKIDTLHDKIDVLSKLMHRLEKTGDDNATESELKDKIRTLEAMIVPLLNNLLKTADRDYIYWPKRTETIKKQLQKVLEITRG